MILPGIAKLARGNAKGADEFSNTPESFAASLAPLIAFPLVGAVITALSGDWKMAMLGFLSRLCAVLVLPVLTYEFAKIFGRKGQWLRTATALNWCYWLVLPAVLVAAILATVAIQFGLPMQRMELGMFGLVGLYLLWNRWFVLKSGLQINGWRAALILLVIIVLTAIFSFLPLLVVGTKLVGIDLHPLS